MINPSSNLWWQTGVIYQIYPRSFKDTTGNGVGDLEGIIQKMDYLDETLGVDAIWLSPFYPSPMADFGYDIADYTDVHPMFGDLETFDRLLSKAHQRDVKVIIDLVPNHSSDHHPWFLESRASRESPKRDWYIWADPKPDGSLPNNWLSIFGGPAWEWDATTGQYYLHSFLKEQPDLNWRNPEVRQAMFGVVRFWLDRGVDGFRIDVAHYIMKDPLMRDNPPNTQRQKYLHKPLEEYDTQIHLYDKGHPDVHEVYRDLREFVDSYDTENPHVTIGEIHIYNLPEWVSYYGRNLDELHMPFNFGLLNTPWQAQAIRKAVDEVEAVLPPGAWPNYVLGNHDESRLASRFGLQNARLAAMLLLTLRGTPTLYYGDEIGMTDVAIRLEEQQDPWGIRVPGLGRDPCRTPMQWSDAENADFSPRGSAELWLPLAKDYQEVNVKRALSQPGSILNLYRQLLALRRDQLSLQLGAYQPVDQMHKDCFVYIRKGTWHPNFLIALNFASNDCTLSLPRMDSGELVLSTHLDRAETIDLTSLKLRGYEGVIIALNL